MLIVMPVWDTEENERGEFTGPSLDALMKSITENDRVVVSDNGSCKATHEIYERLKETHFNFSVIYNGENLGIAKAVNMGWKQAKKDEVVCKIDNDCVINDFGWTKKIEFVFDRMPEVGILGLKRKDLPEQPLADVVHYKTKLHMVTHEPGEPWMVIEESRHVMGTCYCFNPKLRRKIGFLQQPGTVYGFDDAMAAYRTRAAGFKVCFLPVVDIDHIDPGHNEAYTKWKLIEAAEGMKNFHKWMHNIDVGRISIFYNGE